MTDNESLEQQAASWVPPWARTPTPEESKGTFPSDSVEEGHLPIAEPEAAPVAQPAAAEPGDLAEPEPQEATEPQDVIEAEDAVEPEDAFETRDAVEALDAVEDVPEHEAADTGGQADAFDAQPADPAEEAATAADEPVAQPAPDAPDEDDVAEIVAVDDLAAALGLDEPTMPRFDVDGPDDSGEAAVGYAGAKLATPPPGLAEADLVPTLEAILLVVDEPVSELTLAEVLEVPAELIAGTLIDLSASYTRQNRGFDLRRAAGGWRLYTRAEYAPYVERFVLDGQQLRLTQASLETLAVVAYKQPVTRSRISAIRGVNCDGVIRTLVTRGMIEECGTEPESGAFLYRTTSLFLEKLGLDSVDQLPPLAPFLPDNVEEIADEQR
ncbi:SMC-Scp complex subunit ScpB [Catellatospora sp. NPDC049111]|uniref:SMC-Scp complex subunit ScpB n=1 Tax=Catellatospora sp. NPDC049111 TaxID=3155271 RepID=UPI0033ECD441